jgi:hypothetical protein
LVKDAVRVSRLGDGEPIATHPDEITGELGADTESAHDHRARRK